MLSTHRWFLKIFQWILDMHSLWGDTGVPHAVALRVSEGTPGHAVALRVSEGTRGLKQSCAVWHGAISGGPEEFHSPAATHPVHFLLLRKQGGLSLAVLGSGRAGDSHEDGELPRWVRSPGQGSPVGLLLTSSTRAADLHAPNANREEG